MKIIIPMAGRGSRLRPHTLTTPKPLIPIAGKPMVQRLVEDLSAGISEKVTDIAFIIGDFGKQVETDLLEVAKSLGAKGHIFHQTAPLGTAHAILCAESVLDGKCIIAFSDTLFRANFNFNLEEDGIIWVQKVEDPRAFGVVKTNDDGVITDFIEKPETFVSDMAIVGIYYFKKSEDLKRELRYLLDNDIKEKGEYQLTNGLEALKAKGFKFKPAFIEEWLDCGNKQAVLHTNTRFLDFKEENMVSKDIVLENAVIIPPCYIGTNVRIKNSVVGPFVSIGNNSEVSQSVIQRSLVQGDTKIENANLDNSMIGKLVNYEGSAADISIGDFSAYKS